MKEERANSIINIRQVILLLACVFYALPSFSNHVLGGEIGYKWVSGKKFKFQVHVYRNCSECEFNTAGCADVKELEIYLSPEVSATAVLLDKINITRVSRNDITPICKQTASACTGGSFKQGIEDWYFEGEYDFSLLSISNCKFEIGLKIDSRLDAWNIGASESYYNFTRLNLCNAVINTTPDFDAPAFHLIPYNQSFTYNLLAEDNESDSLVFELTEAQKGFNRSITYPSAYTAQNPLDVYCPAGNCNIKPRTWPVEGIGMNKNTGWLGFTPVVNNSTGFLVMQVTEYRKVSGNWVVVGVKRRDLQFLVQDFNNYMPAVKTIKDTFYACAGDAIYLDVMVNDPVYSTRDTVRLKSWNPEINGQLSIAGGNGANNYDALWTLAAGNTLPDAKPYYLTVIGTDNHCPVLGTTYKTVTIIPVLKPVTTFACEYAGCNKVKIKGAVQPGKNEAEAWFVFNAFGQLSASYIGQLDSFEVEKSGKYYIKRQIRNESTGCESESLDSVEVLPFSLMKKSFTWPDRVCNRDTIKLNSTVIGGTAPFVYKWDGITGGVSGSYVVRDSQRVVLNIKDASGCEFRYEKTILTWPYTGLTVTDTSRCLPISGTAVSMDSRFVIKSVPKDNPEMILRNGSGLLNKSNGSYSFKPEGEGDKLFSVTYADEFGCRYSDSFTVKFVLPPSTGIGPIGDKCTNSAEVDIQKESGNKIAIGNWSVKPMTTALSASIFSPVKSGAGQWKLFFTTTYLGCTIVDSTGINVNPHPKISFNTNNRVFLCENSPELKLVAIPTGGTWFSNGPLGNTDKINPSSLLQSGKSEQTQKYLYTDPTTGCSNTDSVLAKVNKLPGVTNLPDTSFCSDAQVLFRPDLSNSAGMRLITWSGPAEVKRAGDGIEFKMLPALVKSKVEVEYLLLALSGCQDLPYKQTIWNKPVPTAQLKASATEGCVPFQSALELVKKGAGPLPDLCNWSNNPGLVTDLKQVLQIDYTGSRIISVNSWLDGCEAEVCSIVITGRETPTAAISVDPEIKATTADFPFFTYRNITKSADSMKLQWTFPGGRPATGFLPRHDVFYPSDTGRYKVFLRVETIHGCVSKTETGVWVAPVFSLHVPTVFTPDSKGPIQNETFHVTSDSMREFKLIVRNKWGQVMFKTNSTAQGWDGTYMGKTVPVGVYAWQLEGRTIYGRFIEKKGTVALLR